MTRVALYRSAPRAGGEQLARVPQRRLRGRVAAEHAGDLLDPLLRLQRADCRPRPARAHGLRHAHVMMRTGGDRREMGHTQHLPPLCNGDELLGNRARRAPTDTRVDLVEHHRRDAVRGGKDHLEPEHRPRQLTAGRDPRQRARVLAGVRRQAEFHTLKTLGRGVLRRQRVEKHLEYRALHSEGADFLLDERGEPGGRRPPGGAELARDGEHLRV